MKNYSLTGVLLLLVMVVAGCTNDNLITEITEEKEASVNQNPAFLKATANALGGPLFDLETAPNGDILVADASKGITNMYGEVETNLPGVNSLSAVGRGNIWATTGPKEESPFDNEQRLYRVNKNRVQLVANLHEFEENYNPDGADVNSNPFDVAALDGNSALVIDAGGNDLLRVDIKGNIEVLAIFPAEVVSTANVKSLLGCPTSEAGPCSLPPMIPAQAVPTTVVIGPDGYYYVGELKGFPAPVGASNIWRVSPDAKGALCGSSPDCVKLMDGGFTSIMDMKFDENGILYIAEMDVRSWFAVEARLGEGGRIQACDPQTLKCEVIATGIPMLTSIAFDKKGQLWATKNALIPGMAEIVQVP